MLLKLAQIRIDGGTQPRCEINQDVVNDYAEAIQDGKTLPPVVVFNDGASYWLADGFHRYFGATKAERDAIHAKVETGTLRDAILYSVGVNAEHGLRRTNADKRKAVMTLLKDEEWSGWSDRVIAERCQVSQPFVSKIRAENTDSGDNGYHLPPVPPPRVTGADGKSYPRPVPPMPPPRPAKVEVPVVRDEIGRVIPDDLIELWNRRQEAQDLMTAVSRVKTTLERAQNNKDALFLEVNFSSAIAHLEQAYTSLGTAKPFAVCPMCHGMKCRACAGRGFVSKFRWDTALAQSFKDAAIAEGGESC
jgi:hypothetical protein